MKNFLLTTILFLSAMLSSLSAQEQTVTVTGKVTDENNEPVIGANVFVKDVPGMGVITDLDGNFILKDVQLYRTLVFSFVGMETQEIIVKDNSMTTINVQLKEASKSVLDEVVVTGTGAQKKITTTGAVSTVDVEQLKTPTSSISNALAGVVPGIIARQTTGQPGQNTSEFWVRGISTFGAGSSALVLVDGFERSLDDLNVEDIESFSVLKDASATAIYGSRGANGVVLITTKRGKAGKVNINAKVETQYNTRTMTPEYVDGYTYASMMNEARTTRSLQPIFTDTEMYFFETGIDPYLYPNVDWMGKLLKDGAMSYRANLDISGGGSTARYFVSASYVNDDGMYRTDETLKDYDTNANYQRWNYRMNFDLDITKTTLLSVGVSGWLSKQNEPGFSNADIWNTLVGSNPVSIPMVYEDGRMPAFGTGNRTNPYVLITQTGYRENWENVIQTNVSLNQKLDFITKGLQFIGRFGFDTYNYNYRGHIQWPEQWRAERQRDTNGDIVYNRISDESTMHQEGSGSGNRREFFEANLQYDRTFGDHIVGATLRYTQDQTTNTTDYSGYNWLPRKHQGLAGRFTYGWKYRYFVDFNFGYNGSENFAPGKQFGFFPAYSAAWNIAEEPFAKQYMPWMNMFKVRYSYGKVGNDDLGSTRFPYLEQFMDGIGSFNFGDYWNDFRVNGLRPSNLATNNVTWEVATKHDVGIDFAFWDNRITGTVDYFHETRSGIYMSRQNIPAIVGLWDRIPYQNVGEVLSKGFDGNAGYNQQIGKVNLTIRGNFTYSRSKHIIGDPARSSYPYTNWEGYRVNQNRGYKALGLFKDYEDIRNSPQQSWNPMPGDIKYKDINADGIIDGNDQVPIGTTSVPGLIYGFGVSALWNGFDFNVHFQGAGKTSQFINGSSIYPFVDGDWGNILTDVVGNYWSEDNPNPNAKYPRLSYGGNANNYQASSYWLRDMSYLRLKTLEIGYTLPSNATRALHIENMRFFLIGSNLLTFSDFDLWDPEMGSSNGQQYPLSRSVTVGLTIRM